MIFESVLNVFLIISSSLSSRTANTRQDLPESPLFNQVVITEIMADPVPQIFLPENEYIEIHNRSISYLNLNACTLRIGSHTIVLPSACIGPGDYLIICDYEADSLFQGYGRTLAVNLPSILNTGQIITLLDSFGNVIHSVHFTDSWYRSSGMADGGRSLEIIDPANPCGSDDNWNVSSDPEGGTPGKINSVKAVNRDMLQPELLRATLPNDSTVLLHFSEPLNPASVSDAMNFSVNQNILHPSEVLPVEPDFSKVLLYYQIPFKPVNNYTVTVLKSPADCVGNPLRGITSVDFALPGTPEVSDIVINEILFNASSDGVEFIELYNRSEKALDLSRIKVSLADYTGDLKKTMSLQDFPFLLLPRKYVVLTSDLRKLLMDHPSGYQGNIIEISEMFTLPDTDALIVLEDKAGFIIDECYYNYAMHLNMLENIEDVSLERVNPDNPSGDPENWHSASTTMGYSTPGMPNSQMTTDMEWNINISTDVISPDEDGIDDYVTLHLQLGEPGWLGTITIFTPEGKRINSLVSNSILGTEEFLIWNGTMQDGSPAEIGLYLLHGELYNTWGNTKKFMKVVALVRK